MAGSSNFVQINPTAANQQTDLVFDGYSLTTGGIGVDATLPSAWLNKAYYQSSTFVAAFAQMMANKGYVVSDADLPTLEAVLANVVTNADTKTPLVTVAYSPTPTFPASTANGFNITLAGNVTSSNFDVAPTVGQILTFVVVQGSTPYSFVPPASVNGWQQISTVPGSINIQQFIVIAGGGIWPLNTTNIPIGSSYNTASGKVVNTVYQNNNTRPIFVSVVFNLLLSVGHTAGAIAKTGVSSPTDIVAATGVGNSSGYCSVGFYVPPGYFYEVNTPIGFSGENNSLTQISWVEY